MPYNIPCTTDGQEIKGGEEVTKLAKIVKRETIRESDHLLFNRFQSISITLIAYFTWTLLQHSSSLLWNQNGTKMWYPSSILSGWKIYRLAQYYSCFMRRIQDGCTRAWICLHLRSLKHIGIFSITGLLSFSIRNTQRVSENACVSFLKWKRGRHIYTFGHWPSSTPSNLNY